MSEAGSEGKAGGCDIDADDDLQGEDCPEDAGEVLEVAVAGGGPAGGEGSGDDAQEDDEGDREDEDAGDELARAAFATEAVGEKTPAEPRDGSELLGGGDGGHGWAPVTL